jgi:hypothetical protein
MRISCTNRDAAGRSVHIFPDSPAGYPTAWTGETGPAGERAAAPALRGDGRHRRRDRVMLSGQRHARGGGQGHAARHSQRRAVRRQPGHRHAARRLRGTPEPGHHPGGDQHPRDSVHAGARIRVHLGRPFRADPGGGTGPGAVRGHERGAGGRVRLRAAAPAIQPDVRGTARGSHRGVCVGAVGHYPGRSGEARPAPDGMHARRGRSHQPERGNP